MKDTLWLIRRNLVSMGRSYKSLLLYLLAPVIGITLSFLIYGNEKPADLRLGIANLDGEQPVAQDLIGFLEGIEGMKITLMADEAEANSAVVGGDSDAAIIVRNGFAQGIQTGEAGGDVEIVTLQDSAVAPYIRSYIDPYLGNLESIAKTAAGSPEAFAEAYAKVRGEAFPVAMELADDRSVQRDMTNRAIGYLIVFMLFSAINLSSFMIKEKENRTYFRLVASPLSGRTYVASNIAVNLLLLLVQIIAMLAIMNGIFGIKPDVPLWQLGAMLFLFASAAVALSLVVVAFSSSSMTVNAVSNFLIIPSCLLAGCMFPVELMPESIRDIASFLPQRWLLEAVNQLQLGASLPDLALHALILLAFTAVFALAAIYKFGHNRDTRTYI
ncbi:ABC transporter permease [Paenibacillus soyae]|uniref:ABC transporter permease n=1 Tax=Paenibacillus soyae TaxID=2969249 RepID=A0A9X2MW92_9BACL|nr:ABC transporter permease [Paenibacillus soyae]MCR2808029.1 ABC transporter permease [Paenibacillus soyae]